MRRALAAIIGLALVGTTLTGGGPAQARGPADYVYEREWIYSTNASEVPDAMGIDSQGRVYLVADKAGYGETDSRMRVYDSSGTLLTTWDVPVRLVTSIDFDAAGNLLLTDYYGDLINGRRSSVQVWTPQGQLVATHYLPTDSHTAGSVARAADGSYWVTDPTTDVIRHYSPGGGELGVIGGTGTAAGLLDSPWGLDILPDGNLVVADTGNDRIQVLSPTGAPVAAWGQAGTAPGQFVNGPSDVDVSPDGLVYVADNSNQIHVFTQAGGFVGMFPALTKRGDQISSLSDVAFGPDGAFHAAGTLYPFENGVARYVPTTVTTPTQPGKAKVTASKKPLRITKRKLPVTIACSKAGPCTGKVTVKVRGKALTKSRSYFVAAGKKAKLRLKVTGKGLRLVPRKGSVKAKARTADRTTTIRVRR